MVNQIPLEDFFRNPEKTAYSLSPDGTYYAFLAPYKDRKNIFVQKIGSGQVVQVTHVIDRDLSGFFLGQRRTIDVCTGLWWGRKLSFIFGYKRRYR